MQCNKNDTGIMLKKSKKQILLLEAFNGGSHKQMMDYLKDVICRNGHSCHSIEMSDKKWHWRMRTSSLYFSQQLMVRDSSSLKFE